MCWCFIHYCHSFYCTPQATFKRSQLRCNLPFFPTTLQLTLFPNYAATYPFPNYAATYPFSQLRCNLPFFPTTLQLTLFPIELLPVASRSAKILRVTFLWISIIIIIWLSTSCPSWFKNRYVSSYHYCKQVSNPVCAITTLHQ